MTETKIQLSAAEMQLMCDAEVILTKNKVLQKTAQLLLGVQQSMHEDAQNAKGDKELFLVPPKISRGENYLGLPYLVLDYPRHFKAEDTFAIRTFFWWGRFFSSTWHLSGHYKQKAFKNIAAAYATLAEHHYIGINPDPWHHHFEEDNYQPIHLFTPKEFEQELARHPHIKIAARWPLSQWPSAANVLLESWSLYLSIYEA